VELTFELVHPIDAVFPFLSDMATFVSVHPLIYKAQNISPNHYLIYEKIKQGPFTHSFTYPAWVESEPTKKLVRMRAIIKRLVKVDMTFELSPHQGGTLIKEQVEFSTILPIKWLLSAIFKKQHANLFKSIGERLDLKNQELSK